MKAGDKIVCRGSRGYMLTTNKVYEVVDYQPSARVDHFTWPAYVAVIDDYGTKVWCHAHRFTTEEQP
ncbi:hypothetical protein XaavBphi31_23 [Xanthomonas phage Xaa_vB_phi31]|uniref:Uncharacterized protein n=1 Tax=Xanthomonas phage Xaa_vB_phi31 TaxID=2776752 RepID=A0A868C0D1_9CAUD|nr:hypothetical protein XaavBphi31_23 [Xanthomonas phage Xaa_vB_phi31]